MKIYTKICYIIVTTISNIQFESAYFSYFNGFFFKSFYYFCLLFLYFLLFDDAVVAIDENPVSFSRYFLYCVIGVHIFDLNET